VLPRHLRDRTAPFRGPDGEVLTNSIAEIRHLRLGGVDQWVMIRGEDIANPPLILLHGGPGMSETRFFRLCNAPLEKSFTLVYWDQRGTGKSFHPDIPRSSMSVEQFISDLDELVDTVCQRLGQSRVVIFGHSWGSALGVLYAARFPEKVAAYVGCGQYGDAAAGEAASYAYAIREAERRGKKRVLKKLRAIGPPPHARKQLMVERTCVASLEGMMRPAKWWDLARVAIGVRESSIIDLPRRVRGFNFSLDALWAEASRLNLLELAPALEMPVFFFLGRNDHWVPPEVSVDYVEALAAPSKELVWFEKSGHEPFADEPDKFNAATVELVRPVVTPEPGDRGLPVATPSC
jgi:pimeloyl-ACP methyl ester carboxylesterase